VFDSLDGPSDVTEGFVAAGEWVPLTVSHISALMNQICESTGENTAAAIEFAEALRRSLARTGASIPDPGIQDEGRVGTSSSISPKRCAQIKTMVTINAMTSKLL